MIDLAERYGVQGRLEEAAQMRQAGHDREGRKTPDTYNLGNLSAAYMQLGRLEEALSRAREAIAAMKHSKKVYAFLDHLGLLCCNPGRLAEGARLIGRSDEHYRDSGFEREMSEMRSRAQAEILLRDAFDDARLTDRFQGGCTMPVADALNAGRCA